MNCAVIVETRPLHNLVDIINGHMKWLPGWSLMVFGSKKNEKMIEDAFNCDFGNIKQDQMTPYHYNRLLTDAGFWRLLAPKYDNVLVFQHDSMLLRAGIEGFMNWDYVGAPWSHINMLGGNGGLSIRNAMKMYEICKSFKYNHTIDGNEDIFACKRLAEIGAEIAPRDRAMQFSVETIFYPRPIGIHAPERYLKKHLVDLIYQYAKDDQYATEVQPLRIET